MPKLLTALQDADVGMLPALAEIWGVPIKNIAQPDVPKTLATAMLEPERAEVVWDMLGDQERGALQMILGNKSLQMPKALFERDYKEIKKMGRAEIDRLKPHRNPQSPAQALYYRGLIYDGFDKRGANIVPIVFVPEDLANILPVHKTSYQELDDEEPMTNFAGENEDDEEEDETFDELSIEVVDESDLEDIQLADTSLVDDMTTLLAYLRLFGAAVEGDSFLPVEYDRILPYLLKRQPQRLTFLLGVGVTAELITVQEGRAYPRRDGLQKWLGLPRWSQVKSLAEAWRDGIIYQEMWHIEGLYPDPQAFAYDPLIARRGVLDFLAKLPPPKVWWSVQDFIDVIKQTEPDFQRPNGDYNSWLIRNEDNEYLRGFESWDAIEGALIEFLLYQPLHWLGMTDVADEAVRLNVYGRAFVSGESFPQPADPEEKVVVREDGTFFASRKVSRSDRFTLARFTTWQANAEPFTYKLDAHSLERASEQGINAPQIEAFLKKQLESKPIPKAIVNLLKFAQSGAVGEVTMEALLVLRTTSPEMLDRLFEEPAFRRYLGAKLGPMACVIRADQRDDLKSKLEQNGIRVELIG